MVGNLLEIDGGPVGRRHGAGRPGCYKGREGYLPIIIYANRAAEFDPDRKN
jgi:hypothetical protein